MIRLVNKKLIIPRGDTGSFSLPALTSLSEGDKAIFSIIDTRTNKILLPKECTYENDILTIEFTHYDTVNLPVGKYYWDIKIYQGAEIVDNQIVNGIEVDSYYAAYQLPACQIRQTGDKLLTTDNDNASVLNNENFNLLNATLNEVRDANSALQQYKGEIQTMLHQEERLEAVQTAVQTLTNNLPEPLNYIKNEVAIGSIIEGKITGDEANRASQYSHAEGEYTLALGSASHSEGRYATYTDSNTSQLVTQPTAAYSLASHAEGEGTMASGNAAHSEGKLTQASGATAHAEGHKTIAYGNSSHAEGQGTYAKHWAQHVFGLYNVQDPSTEQPHRRGNYIEIVGNGQNNDNRSNARTLDWSGNESLAGGLTLGKGTADEVTITATQLKQLLTLLS